MSTHAISLTVLLSLLFPLHFIFAGESFLLLNTANNSIVQQWGANNNTRFSPGSTFKILLSLIGYDIGSLQDEQHPLWEYQEHLLSSEDKSGVPGKFLELWQQPQTPQTWMRYSCLWFSQVLATQLGLHAIQRYLNLFNYGNQDMTGEPGKDNGLTHAWLSSSLAISPLEQVQFLYDMLQARINVSEHALNMTKNILFIEELIHGWKLFGKTGLSRVDHNNRIGWFIGWIEKEQRKYIFAYHILDKEIDYTQRISRIKSLLEKFLV